MNQPAYVVEPDVSNAGSHRRVSTCETVIYPLNNGDNNPPSTR